MRHWRHLPRRPFQRHNEYVHRRVIARRSVPVLGPIAPPHQAPPRVPRDDRIPEAIGGDAPVAPGGEVVPRRTNLPDVVSRSVCRFVACDEDVRPALGLVVDGSKVRLRKIRRYPVRLHQPRQVHILAIPRDGAPVSEGIPLGNLRWNEGAHLLRPHHVHCFQIDLHQERLHRIEFRISRIHRQEFRTAQVPVGRPLQKPRGAPHDVHVGHLVLRSYASQRLGTHARDNVGLPRLALDPLAVGVDERIRLGVELFAPGEFPAVRLDFRHEAFQVGGPRTEISRRRPVGGAERVPSSRRGPHHDQHVAPARDIAAGSE
mmetsp:Transcript_11653/g.24966  ORF Transcript_11653/g.24966 Transcript_11653/m.24966 type:complete len:317 (-) Transcript_11653:1934-2884(-)